MAKREAAPDTRYRRAAVGLAVGAMILFIGARMTWLTVTAFDDLSGQQVVSLPGASWSTEVPALALALLVAACAGAAIRRVGRRVIGVVAAIVSVGASWGPMRILTAGVDSERARSLLTMGTVQQSTSESARISSRAVIEAIDIQTVGPVVALVGCAVALVAAMVLALRPGQDGRQLSRFERAAQRRERLAEDVVSSLDSARVMWDALDEDIDPTDISSTADGEGRRG